MRFVASCRPLASLVFLAVAASSVGCLAEGEEDLATYSAAATSLGSGWFGTNLGGSAALNGTSSLVGNVFTLAGGGGDFWGAQDNGHLVFQPVTGDFDLSVRVTGFGGDLNETFCKTVLAFKEGVGGEPTATAPGVYQSLNVFSDDYWYQRGTTGIDDFSSTGLNGPGQGAYLRLTRSGNVFRSFVFDTNTMAWTQIGADRVVPLTAAGFVGFGVTSTSNQLMTATFTDVVLAGPGPDTSGPLLSNITVEPLGTSAIVRWQTNESSGSVVEYGLASPNENAVGTLGYSTNHAITLKNLTASTTYFYRIGSVDAAGNATSSVNLSFNSGNGTVPGGLPAPWQHVALGGSAGSAGFAGGVFQVTGNGGDMWGGQDNIHLVYRPVVGDFEVIAQVDGYAGDVSNQYALAALLFKEGTGAPTATGRGVYQTLGYSSDDYLYQRMGATPDGYTNHNLNSTGGSARLRMTRTGNIFRAYRWNGNNWVQYGGNRNLALNVQGFVAIGSSSGAAGLMTASFSSVSLTGGDDEPPVPDNTPPVISAVAATPGSNNATITWTTNEAATSRVDYGTTVALGSQATVAGLVTSHSVVLSGLAPQTNYSYRVTSLDASNNQAQSSIVSFVTLPLGSGAVQIANISISAITAHSAQISWTTNVPTFTEIDYDLNAWAKEKRTFVLSTSHSAVVDRLMAGGNHTFVITADDGNGDVAVSPEASFNTSALSGGALPANWASQDIGLVSTLLPGSASFDPGLEGGSFIVRGTGTDVFFAADSFHFVHFPVVGDFVFTLRVAGYYGYLHEWTKAMTMFRVDLDPDSQMFNQSINYEGDDYLYYRAVKGTQHTEITHGQIHQGTGLPLFARLIRTGNNFREQISYDGINFVPNGPAGGTVVNLPTSGYVGFGVCSKSNDFLSEIIYSNVTVDNPGGPGDNFAPIVSDVAVEAVDDTAVVTWKTSEPATSVVDYGPSEALGLTASSPELTTDHRVELNGLLPNASYFVRVRSSDQLGNIAIAPSVELTSGALAELPLGWAQIGLAAVGEAFFGGGEFAISGGGGDLWGSGDHAQLVYQSVRDDFDLIARVDGWEGDLSDLRSKAALVFKEDLGAGKPLAQARGVVQTLTRDGADLWFERGSFQIAPGITSAELNAVGEGAMLRLSRRGNSFRSYVWDGSAWQAIGPARQVPLDRDGYVGLAVTGGDNLATVRFSQVSVTKP